MRNVLQNQRWQGSGKVEVREDSVIHSTDICISLCLLCVGHWQTVVCKRNSVCIFIDFYNLVKNKEEVMFDLGQGG